MENQTTEASGTEVIAVDVSTLLKSPDARKMSFADSLAAARSGKLDLGQKAKDTPSASGQQDASTENEVVEETAKAENGNDEHGKQEPSEGIKSRFKKLTEARDRAEQKSADLEARLLALEQKQPATREATAKVDQPTSGDFQFDEVEPNPDDFKTVAEYTKALIRYDLKKERAEAKVSEHKETIAKTFRDKFTQFELAGADVEKKLGLEEGVFDVFVKDPDFKMSDPAKDAILESERGADIAYEIASNLSTRTAFAKMTPAQQLQFIGKMEAKLEPVTEAKGGTKKTNAKPIGTPVRGSAPAAITSILNKPLNSITGGFKDMAEYKKARGM